MADRHNPWFEISPEIVHLGFKQLPLRILLHRQTDTNRLQTALPNHQRKRTVYSQLHFQD